jgi:hypothetical protein
MKTNCEHHKDCLKLIQKILDREASPAEEATFLLSKDQCLPCQEGYRLEASLKKAIKEQCHQKCPDSLLEQIKAKLFLFFILISILIPLLC